MPGISGLGAPGNKDQLFELKLTVKGVEIPCKCDFFTPVHKPPTNHTMPLDTWIRVNGWDLHLRIQQVFGGRMVILSPTSHGFRGKWRDILKGNYYQTYLDLPSV